MKVVMECTESHEQRPKNKRIHCPQCGGKVKRIPYNELCNENHYRGHNEMTITSGIQVYKRGQRWHSAEMSEVLKLNISGKEYSKCRQYTSTAKTAEV